MIEDEITIQNKLEFFHIVFAEEFDSIFSADIICCEECVDEFIKYWPGVYINDQDFQTYSIQISSLYSMMRFSDFKTEDEFNQFSSGLVCPRCNQKLRGIIYPYNMPFNVPYGFKQLVGEIAKIAYETPFLLLTHPFALEVFQEITNISQTIDPEILSDAVYRARIFNNEIVYTAADFFTPPKEKVAEGRYNHAGKQVLYLSEEPEACFHELRSPQEGVMIANIRIKKPIKVLDLTMQAHESNIINLIRWSSLMSSPNEGEGWHKPHYVFTRFIADCAKAAGFHAIKYPSVRFDEGMNLALISYSEHTNDFQVDEIFLFNDSNTKIEILKQRLMESLSSEFIKW
ncbi:RES family NAD+ phosphorylase [Paenibacillus sonchi]|uniref:RES family NAD+ phosphorylase n=1 Tax=Paenibacillus sonchi TaxID=373687 RepID=A0A974SC71_9BACL|nr:RES family NAD+ phosphorylase [Paenibacillus sonchi]QQZ61123.1 RES family NAD+ phosphorylase [Paenibacillus sonchi]